MSQTPDIQKERISLLNSSPLATGAYVLYWMQASQRVTQNHALEYAIRKANDLTLPLVVFFGVTDRFPEANLRHYAFMLQGIAETAQRLRDRDVLFVLRKTSPEKGALELAGRASLVVVDRGYLRIQKTWRRFLAERAPCPVIQVESDVVVPVETASKKEEYAASTLRPKISRLLPYFLRPVEETLLKRTSLGMDLETMDATDAEGVLEGLEIDRSVRRADRFFMGGESEAQRRLADFIATRLEDYAEARNDPTRRVCSDLSPYLHFGQISPLEIALSVLRAEVPERHSIDMFIEELIIRRELAMNFVHFSPDYDSFACLPTWAKDTLDKHRSDGAGPRYSQETFEKAATHDPYWNAAQKEMLVMGKMHGYMRMYWGKKILEWSRTPDEAFKTALILNNRYELDGRDPNGFAGVAWCFGKHDRPWPERPVFGTVRSMAASGLRKKFPIDTYVRLVEDMATGGKRPSTGDLFSGQGEKS